MYKKLLISSGGGIIAKDQQADQACAATIAIGLGGTGISCLRTLKREVYSRVKPDPDSDLVAKYDHIRFLAVDTDRSSLGSGDSIDSLDEGSEFQYIGCPNISELLNNVHTLSQDSSLRWLKSASAQGDGSGITIMSAKAGAGGVRQIGRLLLFQNCQAIINKLTTIITAARRNLPGTADINIHIFTGMSGGTGAGTFLDMCYIVKKVLRDLGIAGQAYVCGFFFMPDVNIADGVNESYLPINGFSSMKELDYAMNYANNGGRWKQTYPGFEMDTAEPPVDLAHIVTATDATGAVRSKGFDYCMHAVTDYVMEFIVKPFVPDGADSSDSAQYFSINSHIANIKNHIAMVRKKRGASYDYCVLGASSAFLPYKEITTYLVSKIFEGFSGLINRVPDKKDVDEFIKRNALSYEELIRALCDGVPTVPIYAVDHKTLYDQVEGISADSIPQILGQMRDSTSAISGALAKNKSAMLDTVGTAKNASGKEIVSLFARVKKALVGDAANAEKGPYYASAMLVSLDNTDLCNIIRGYIIQNLNNLDKFQSDMSLRTQSLDNALRELQSSNSLNRKKRAEQYVGAVHAYYMHTAKIETYMVLGDILSEIEKLLRNIHDNYFSIFARVMAQLQSTFDENKSTLLTPVTADINYAFKIMSIQDLSDTLDNTVKQMQIPDIIHSFVSELIEKDNIWITEDESKISAEVSKFFVNALGSHTQKTIIDYLKIKYDTTAPEQLKNYIKNDIITRLDQKAAALFWLNGSYFQLTDSHPIGYLSMPDGIQEIDAAISEYIQSSTSGGVSPRKVVANDRITMFRMNCGIPMFGYKGAENYLPAYKHSPIVGSHLYEGTNADPRDSRLFPDIMPISAIPPEKQTQLQKKYVEDYSRAEKLDIISETEIGQQKEYHLNMFDSGAFEALKKSVEGALNTGDILKLKAAEAALAGTKPQISSSRIIPNTGFGDYSKLVIMDHILDSVLLRGIMEEQLKIWDEYNNTLKSVKNTIASTGKYETDVQMFARALFCGIIVLGDDKFTFSYTKKDLLGDTAVILSDVNSKFGYQMPVFSAFLAFEALNDVEKEYIDSCIKTKLTTERGSLGEAVEAVKKTLNPETIKNHLDDLVKFDADVFPKAHSLIERITNEYKSFVSMI